MEVSQSELFILIMLQMDKNSLRVTNQKTGKWSCDQNSKLSNRTTTSAGEVGTSEVVVVMNLM